MKIFEKMFLIALKSVIFKKNKINDKVKVMNLFGRKKKLFIQEANRRSVLKGTVGSFRSWCKSQGLTKDGKVTLKCVNKGLKSSNTSIKRKANFAKNIGGYVGAKRPSFGKSTIKVKKTVKKKYTLAGGRKSPKFSAKSFPVGTVKKGLDNNNWLIVKVGNSQRWKRVSSFGKRNYRFGSEYDADEYINDILEEHIKIENKIEKEIELAEDILDYFPDGIPEKKHATSLLNKIKNLITIKNTKSFFINLYKIISYLAELTIVIMQLRSGYVDLHTASATFRTVTSPVDKMINKFSKNEKDIEEKINKGVDKQFEDLGWKKIIINGKVHWINPFGSTHGFNNMSGDD